MAFIDELKIFVEAGKGGNGVVRWRQEKFIPKGGPAGGDGGRGGNFKVRAVRDINILSKYKAKKKFKAENGQDGGGSALHGKNGEDLILEFPVGSIITNIDTEEIWQLLKEGEEFSLLRGGYGGYGNLHFKSSTNTTPKESNKGGVGESGNFNIELELIADIGLIGYPSAGKSSLLNMITNADAKVGNYDFTTLDPNLGDFYGYIIADLPGLIEGASEGKGLGIKFLRHIKRTKMLAHLVSLENEKPLTVYKEIRKELEKYDKDNSLGTDGLSKKDEIIILTKSDILDKEKLIEKKKKEFEKYFEKEKSKKKKKIFVLSLYDDLSIKNLKDNLIKILNKK